MPPAIHTSANTALLPGFLLQLRSRNRLLFYFGAINLMGALASLLLVAPDPQNQVLGINAWIKPAKFSLSIWLLCWTLAWYLVYWEDRKAVQRFGYATVVTMTIEMVIITWQAANGRLSHFNISTPLYGMLFSLMGVAITIFTLWVLYMNILFFRQQQFPIWMTDGYKEGIRWGMLLFVVFAFEGGLMASRLQHTVGAPDGGAGLPFLNWSLEAGDLRVAHFFGMHALQVLPITGYYLARERWQIHLFTLAYLLFVSLLLWQALEGYPLL